MAMSRKIKIVTTLLMLIFFTFVLSSLFYFRFQHTNLTVQLPDKVYDNPSIILRRPKVYRTSNIDIGYLLNTPPLYHTMKIPPNSRCREKKPRFLRQKLPTTALVSYPGSGSTWVRHLVQQMTGIATGSIECRNELKKSKAFALGECENSDRVILINTNRQYIQGKFEEKFQKLIVLKRNAFDTLRSAYTMKHPGHSESVDSEIYNVRGWWEFIRDETVSYEDYYSFWMDPKIHTFLLYYEDLQNNLRATLKKLARYLEWPVSATDLDCTVTLAEGYFHRRHVHNLTNEDVFVGKLWNELKNAEIGISEVVEGKRKEGNLIESGDVLKLVLEKAKEEFYDEFTL